MATTTLLDFIKQQRLEEEEKARLEQMRKEMQAELIHSQGYTAFKLEADGTLSNETKCKDAWEVNNWIGEYQFNYIIIRQNATGLAKRGYRLDVGYDWEKLGKAEDLFPPQ